MIEILNHFSGGIIPEMSAIVIRDGWAYAKSSNGACAVKLPPEWGDINATIEMSLLKKGISAMASTNYKVVDKDEAIILKGTGTVKIAKAGFEKDVPVFRTITRDYVPISELIASISEANAFTTQEAMSSWSNVYIDNEAVVSISFPSTMYFRMAEKPYPYMIFRRDIVKFLTDDMKAHWDDNILSLIGENVIIEVADNGVKRIPDVVWGHLNAHISDDGIGFSPIQVAAIVNGLKQFSNSELDNLAAMRFQDGNVVISDISETIKFTQEVPWRGQPFSVNKTLFIRGLMLAQKMNIREDSVVFTKDKTRLVVAKIVYK